MAPDVNVGGKASSLIVMKSILGISVPPFTVLQGSLTESQRQERIEAFLREHPEVQHVAVRSSALNEDSSQASFAGLFATKLHVPANALAITGAVEEIHAHGTSKAKVVSHYATNRGLQGSGERIATVVQKMVQADFSGVILSHSLRARDGYYLVSLTQGIGESVVSGTVNGKLVRIARAANPSELSENWLARLIEAMKRLESHFRNESLDVEFAFEKDELHILQCRPLATNPEPLVDAKDEAAIASKLRNLAASIEAHHGGDVLGDMIDINPAELLGRTPTRLDVSIFGLLFADKIVEEIREAMGYDPLNIGLVREIAEKPYVSLKASAFSFRPKGIPSHVYEKLYSVYREMVIANPDLQSRVEFAVFAMQPGDKLESLMERAGFGENERSAIRESYRNLDASLVASSSTCSATQSSWLAQYAKGFIDDESRSLEEQLERVQIGTRQFVQVARLAFYWKNRFEEKHTGINLNELLVGHMHSASSRMQRDLLAYRNGELDRSDVIERYGHLRPGQFCVFGESYRDDPEHYLFDRLDELREQHIAKRPHQYETTEEFRNVVTFLQAREETKFLFSRAFDTFVRSLKAALSTRGISHETAAQCSWSELAGALKANARPSLESRKTPAVILPDVIIPGLSDLQIITSHTAAPSYITQETVKGRVCVLENPSEHEDLSGAIVLIPSADPGYDFLFHSGAAGIITRTGGPASHMCIRAVEMQMPSCIGCGENVYEALSRVRIAVLDCKSGQIIAPD